MSGEGREASRKGGRKRWLAFAAVVAAAMMDLIDGSVTFVAGPSIRADVGGSYADLQWIAAAYTLAMAVGLLLGGRLGDMFGRKRMLLIGVAGFTFASVVAAAAPSAEALIGARVLQGALGAVMLPQVFGLIRDLFPPAEMAKAWAVFGPVAGLSAVLGPILAGLVIDADLFGSGWRMVFLLNVPVGIAVIVAGARLLPDVAPSETSRRIDGRGLALAAIGTAAVVYPLVQGREHGWPLWTFAMIAAGLGVLALFATQQVRRSRAGATTLVEPSIFRNRSYVSGVGFMQLFLGTMAGITLTFTVFLQAGLGWSPIKASLTMAPWALGGFVGSAAGGMFVAKLGRRILHSGLVLMAGGLVGLWGVLHYAGMEVAALDFTAPLFVSGIGMGMVFVPLFDIILGGVADREVGSASGLLQAMQQLGMALGVAAVGTLFFELLGPQRDFAGAVEVTTAVLVGLLAIAFAVGFLLPRKARVMEAPAEPVA